MVLVVVVDVVDVVDVVEELGAGLATTVAAGALATELTTISTVEAGWPSAFFSTGRSFAEISTIAGAVELLLTGG